MAYLMLVVVVAIVFVLQQSVSKNEQLLAAHETLLVQQHDKLSQAITAQCKTLEAAIILHIQGEHRDEELLRQVQFNTDHISRAKAQKPFFSRKEWEAGILLLQQAARAARALDCYVPPVRGVTK